jgi:polysaccharide biosynthesis protein PslH
MKILQICNKPPFPSVDGGTMAMQNLSEALYLQNHHVKVIALNTQKHFSRIEKVPAEIRRKYKLEYFFINTRITVLNTLLNLLTSKPFHASRFFNSEFSNKITTLIDVENFDVIILDSVFCGVYLETIKKTFKGKIILRAHNIEFKLWERIKNKEDNKLKKLYLNIQIKRLEKFESNIIKNVDSIIAITHEDKNYLNETYNLTNVFVFPYTVKQIFSPKIPKNRAINFYHLGSMDWIPNLDGLEWFLKNVWNNYFLNNNFMFFRMAGRSMPEFLIARSEKNLFIQGEINDADNFVQSSDVMICPLFSGGGMRIKIIEALSHGKPVIATKIAAEGIPYFNYIPSPILIAENEKDFEIFIHQIMDSSYYESLSKMAIKLIEENFLLDPLSKKLSEFITFGVNKTSN